MSYFAEQNVVGSLLMDGDAIERVATILEPEMFTAELLGRVYLIHRKSGNSSGAAGRR